MSETTDDLSAEAEIYSDWFDTQFYGDIWTTEDGTQIPVKDLDDNHIRHIINMFPEAVNVSIEADKRGIK